jgi:diguanylate cyclase (GGDEF)-like protein
VTPHKCSLLVIDDDPGVLSTLVALASKDFDVLAAGSAEAAQQLFAVRAIDLVLADQNLPGMTGVQLLEWVRNHHPSTVRLLMTGLARFEDAVEAINCGQVFRYLFKPWRGGELLEVLRSASRTFLLERSHDQLLGELRQLNLDLEQRVNQRTRELQDANHQLQQQNLMLQRLALTDPLTGLPNRRAIDQLVKSELRRRNRYPNPLALGFIDVDHFKDINARYLLPGGDQVLLGLSKTFINALRTVDTVGRIGGEEFMVVAPETDLQGAVILGERIRTAVEESRCQYKEMAIAVTISLGFSVIEADAHAEYDQLKHAAAAAMQEAKSRGRNLCVTLPLAASNDVAVPAALPLGSVDSGA